MKTILLILGLFIALNINVKAQCYYYNNSAKSIIGSHNPQSVKLYDNDTSTSENFLISYRITEAIYNYDQQGTDAYHLYYNYPQNDTILKIGEYHSELPNDFYIYIVWALEKQYPEMDYSDTTFYNSLFLEFMNVSHDLHNTTKSSVTYHYDTLPKHLASGNLVYTQTTWDSLGEIGWLYEYWGNGKIQHKFGVGSTITDTLKLFEYYIWANQYSLNLDSIIQENINDNVKDGLNMRLDGDSTVTIDRQLSIVNDDALNKILSDNFQIEYEWLLNGNIVSDSSRLNINFKYTEPFTLTWNVKFTKNVFLFNNDFCTATKDHKVELQIITSVKDVPQIEKGKEIIGYYNTIGQKIEDIKNYSGLYLEVYRIKDKFFTNKLYK